MILFAGNEMVYNCDWALYFCKSCNRTPSMLSSRLVALSICVLAHLRRSCSVFPSPPAIEHSVFNIGKKSDTPEGIVHCRTAEPPNVPAKNHTAPVCLIPHLSPV